MHKRWIRRRLPVLIFTFFIILYVDFQLRTNSLPKVSVAHHPSPAQHHSTQQTPSSAKDTQNPANISRISRSRNGRHSARENIHVTRPKLKLEDIFIAVKTTGRFHKTRLALLLETWISRTRAHVSVVSVLLWVALTFIVRSATAFAQSHMHPCLIPRRTYNIASFRKDLRWNSWICSNSLYCEFFSLKKIYLTQHKADVLQG